MEYALRLNGLTKRYGDIIAVDNISLDLHKGEIFGLLGPNGAGKTTTVEMIEGLRRPDSGTIEVHGIDALNEPGKIKEIIGVQLQSTSLYDQIRVKEAIDLFRSYYKRSISTEELLEEVSLTEKKNSYYRTLSGGQKQRVAMALALVNDPKILFLDEPTTGLDPQARRNVWDVIKRLRRSQKTIILTTHYMEEAEKLCQRVGIIDHGRIIALDTPKGLIEKAGLGSTVEFESDSYLDDSVLEDLKAIGELIAEEGGKFMINTKDSSKAIRGLAKISEQMEIEIENISVRKATLEDVFLSLTGRRLRE